MDDNLKSEIDEAIAEANEIYEYIQSKHGRQEWMGDTERFMALTFLTTRDLVKESIVLSRLTRGLIGLTIALGFLTLTQVGILSYQIICRVPKGG
ncbi:MAG: hypothetical protein PHN78_02735 [Dehalococcoidales bacterium]|nr:hypothetical protein [Dehalococcoidales bacterium]